LLDPGCLISILDTGWRSVPRIGVIEGSMLVPQSVFAGIRLILCQRRPSCGTQKCDAWCRIPAFL